MKPTLKPSPSQSMRNSLWLSKFLQHTPWMKSKVSLHFQSYAWKILLIKSFNMISSTVHSTTSIQVFSYFMELLRALGICCPFHHLIMTPHLHHEMYFVICCYGRTSCRPVSERPSVGYLKFLDSGEKSSTAVWDQSFPVFWWRLAASCRSRMCWNVSMLMSSWLIWLDA